MAEQQHKHIWDSFTDEQKIAAACVVFHALGENAKNPYGSFRGLIYNQLGMPSDAYGPCYLAGGLDLNNMLHEVMSKVEITEHQVECPQEPQEAASAAKAVSLDAGAGIAPECEDV